MSPRTRSPLQAVAAVVVALLLTLAACSDGGDGPKSDTLPAPMPELVLAGFADQPDRNLAEIDSPTLINLWASNCAPCRKEMPLLEEFHQKYKGRVDVLGVNFQEPQSRAAEELVAATGVTYPLVADFEGNINGLTPFPRVRGLPLLAFVDAEGQLVAIEYVLFDELAELEEVVGRHLELGPSADEDAA